MITMNQFRKLSEFEWEIPIDFRSDMRVPVRMFASESLIKDSLGDHSLEQANAGYAPGIWLSNWWCGSDGY